MSAEGAAGPVYYDAAAGLRSRGEMGGILEQAGVSIILVSGSYQPSTSRDRTLDDLRSVEVRSSGTYRAGGLPIQTWVTIGGEIAPMGGPGSSGSGSRASFATRSTTAMTSAASSFTLTSASRR